VTTRTDFDRGRRRRVGQVQETDRGIHYAVRTAILATRVWALWDGYVTISSVGSILTLTPQEQGKGHQLTCRNYSKTTHR
jgi:hypothetical protein